MGSLFMNLCHPKEPRPFMEFTVYSHINLFGAFFKPYRGVKDVANTLLATISAPFLLAAVTAIATALCALCLALLPVFLIMHGLNFLFSSNQETKAKNVGCIKKDLSDVAAILLSTLHVAALTAFSIPVTLLRIPSRAIATVVDCLQPKSEEFIFS